MNHLLALLKDANVTQTTDWGIFQRHPKNIFFMNIPLNSTHTEVHVKFNDAIQKYEFDILGKLVNLSTQAHDA